MYQQLDCNAAAATAQNASGCAADLFPWVETSVGAGSNGKAPPSPFTDEIDRRGLDRDGLLQRPDRRRALSEVSGRRLHDERQLSSAGDGRHGRQSHHDGRGRRRSGSATARAAPRLRPTMASIPPIPSTPAPGNPNSVSEIENPNPQPGTNNYYTQDGYGGGPSYPDTPWITREPLSPKNYGGGSYVNCADSTQPGVRVVLTYLGSLARPVPAKCARRPLLSRQQLQSRIFRRRLQRLYRHQPEQLPSTRSRRPAWKPSATS